MRYIIQGNSRNYGEHWGDQWTYRTDCSSLEIAEIELAALKKRYPIEFRIVTQSLTTTVVC